jgi:hypothetical protein
MAESTESASASYSSSSTSFAAETETIVSDCDSGEEAEVETGPSTKVVSLLDRLRFFLYDSLMHQKEAYRNGKVALANN